MSRINFKELLTKNDKMVDSENSASITLKNGELYPLQLLTPIRPNSQTCVICFVSLSCMLCIDLLPELPAFLETYQGDFILVIDGTEEECREIAEFHGFAFALIPYTKDYKSLHVPSTPFAYYIDEHGSVIGSEQLKGLADLQSLVS